MAWPALPAAPMTEVIAAAQKMMPKAEGVHYEEQELMSSSLSFLVVD